MTASIQLRAALILLLPGCVVPPGTTIPPVGAGSNHASVLVKAAETIPAIAACPLDSRAQLLADIRNREQAAAKALQAIARLTDPDMRAAAERWREAMTVVETRADELDRRLDEADQAAPENWPAVRTLLAASYTAYASAVIMAESAAYPER